MAATPQPASHIILNDSNFVAIRNEINYETVTKAQLEMAEQVSKRGNKSYVIYLVLDSPGGSISAGMDLIESFQTIPRLETVTLFAASMASAIVEALPGKRHVISSGTLMFHRARGGFQGQFEDGEVESQLAYSKAVVRKLETTNSDRMQMPLAEYKALVLNELWIFGADNVTKKAVDDVVTLACTDSIIAKKNIESIDFMGSSIDIALSACPLIKVGAPVDKSQSKLFKEYTKQKGVANETKIR